jgi:hypothetical protein
MHGFMSEAIASLKELIFKNLCSCGTVAYHLNNSYPCSIFLPQNAESGYSDAFAQAHFKEAIYIYIPQKFTG